MLRLDTNPNHVIIFSWMNQTEKLNKYENIHILIKMIICAVC